MRNSQGKLTSLTENIEEILHALSQRRADDYQDWLTVGMALHHAGAPCSVWDEWSKQSPKYKPDDCSKRWAGFGKSAASPVTIATLVQMAKEDDYKPSAGFGWDDDTKLEEKGSRDGFIHPCGGSALAELKTYLQALFKAGDTVNYVVETFEKDGRWLPNGRGINRSFEALMEACEKNTDVSFVLGDWEKKAGAFIRLNPMNGNGCRNSDVVEFRHTLVECDSLPKAEQLKKIRELKLPCAAIVDSGGKSIHAVVKIDAGKDEHLYRERVAELHAFLESQGFPVDKACKNPSRLSRVAGVTRNGVPQALLGVNVGAKSWEEWCQKRDLEEVKLDEVHIDEMLDSPDNDLSDAILGNRFLCKAGSWLIVAQSGIGKSVMAMQMALHFAIGRELWGVSPHKPRKTLLVQAENNRLDLVEPAKAITGKMNLTPDERELLRKNFVVISEDKSSGDKFIHVLAYICQKHTPEMVIIDPLLSYIGGDISRQDVCSTFLRNRLNPIVHRYQIGLVIMHHTGKPPKEKSVQTASDLSYLGIGSSDLTNWARAVSVIVQNANDPDVYGLTHTKRAKRLDAPATTYLRHGAHGIYWETTTEPTRRVKNSNPRVSKYDYLQLDQMPPLHHCDDASKSEVFAFIKKRLSDAGESTEAKAIDRVFEAIRKLAKPLIVYNPETGVWQGRYYLPETEVKND